MTHHGFERIDGRLGGAVRALSARAILVPCRERRSAPHGRLGELDVDVLVVGIALADEACSQQDIL